MKKTFNSIALILFAAIKANAQPAQNFPNGISLGTGPDTFLSTFTNGSQSGTIMEAPQGGIVLYSVRSETSQSYLDGGLTLIGKPISMVLSADGDPTNQSVGTFDVWRSTDYWSAQNLPVFGIDTGANTAKFNSLNVSITGGNLTIEGSPALTAGTAPSVLGSQGFLQQQNLGSALASMAPPTTASWTSSYVPRGNILPVGGSNEGGFLALGTSTASGSNSIASGYNSVASQMLAIALGTNATACGPFATAVGQNALASGQFSTAVGNGVTSSNSYSFVQGYNTTASGYASIAMGSACSATSSFAFARGNNANASGTYSNAIGFGVSAKARAESAFGTYNIESSPTGSLVINGLYGLFRIGNGLSTSERSDALSILMNGQSTVTNKEWKTATNATPGDSTVALADPPSTTDCGGNALVVDGHAVLNGKVIISVPQGDISMGIYE